MEWEEWTCLWVRRALLSGIIPMLVMLVPEMAWPPMDQWWLKGIFGTLLSRLVYKLVPYTAGVLQTVCWAVSNASGIWRDMQNAPDQYVPEVRKMAAWFLLLEILSKCCHQTMIIHSMTAVTVITLLYQLRKARIASAEITDNRACHTAVMLFYSLVCCFLYALGSQVSDEEWFLGRMPSCTKVNDFRIKCRHAMTSWGWYDYFGNAAKYCGEVQREINFTHESLLIRFTGVSYCATIMRNINYQWYWRWTCSWVLLLTVLLVTCGQFYRSMPSSPFSWTIDLKWIKVGDKKDKKKKNDADPSIDHYRWTIRHMFLSSIVGLIFYWGYHLPVPVRHVAMVVWMSTVCNQRTLSVRISCLVWIVIPPFVFSCDYEMFNLMCLVFTTSI